MSSNDASSIDSEALAALVRDRDGVRLRGEAMTRIETFTDAAFAFALTLLVISVDQIPASFGEFREAMKDIPAFAASFAQIALFWYAHHVWSRRYGLDDRPTVVLSLMFVFVTLIYVYPLRVMFSGLFAWISDGALPFAFGARPTTAELGEIFIIYGVGFFAMSALIALLYLHAGRCADELQLDVRERFTTRAETQAWLLAGSIGLVSVAIALLAPTPYQPLAGFAYTLLPIIMPIFGTIKNRQALALEDPAG